MVHPMTGTPVKNGQYLCWVNPDFDIPFAKIIQLMWIDGRWSYPNSAERYRDHIYQFAGPLPALRLEKNG